MSPLSRIADDDEARRQTSGASRSRDYIDKQCTSGYAALINVHGLRWTKTAGWLWISVYMLAIGEIDDVVHLVEVFVH
jgi:hypothetical protein